MWLSYREFLKGPLFLDEEKIFFGPKVSWQIFIVLPSTVKRPNIFDTLFLKSVFLKNPPNNFWRFV
jgi:hypothetical protein